MKELPLVTAGSTSRILIGAPLGSFADMLGARKAAVVWDAGVPEMSRAALGRYPCMVLPGGEVCKSLSQVEQLYHFFLKQQLDRASLVLAVGGGAVTDVTGFAAATFHRGIPFGFAPSTLLAQVDASIGGKNGIDFAGIKNIVGTITQPQFVICDPRLLSSLPAAEFSNGLAEVIKAAVIADPALFNELEGSIGMLGSAGGATLASVIEKAIAVKAAIVMRDEREARERMKLNFGHTVGHAIEVQSGIPHGQAVAIGMVLETELAVRRGICGPALLERLKNLIRAAGLPLTSELPKQDILAAIQADKKRRGDLITFALPVEIGKVELIDLTLNDLAL